MSRQLNIDWSTETVEYVPGKNCVAIVLYADDGYSTIASCLRLIKSTKGSYGEVEVSTVFKPKRGQFWFHVIFEPQTNNTNSGPVEVTQIKQRKNSSLISFRPSTFIKTGTTARVLGISKDN